MSVKLMQGDCLERMKEIPAGSVDMVLTDPPYGTTACKWDAVIDLEAMWDQIGDVLKPDGACVLTASQPFTSRLVMSNPKAFKYSWVWDKRQVTNFLNASRQPLRRTEDVCVFYYRQPTYNPQKTPGSAYSIKRSHATENYGAQRNNETVNTGSRHPDGVIDIPQVRHKGGHPTQKPVALMEYLIRTYTNPDDTVLDFTMGSGTTGVACVSTGRNFIGIELDTDYFAIAKERIRQAQEKPKEDA